MNGRTLTHSRWATSNNTHRIRITDTETHLIANTEKLSRLLTRLRWKAESLLTSHTRATSTSSTHTHNPSDSALTIIRGPSPPSQKEALTMFKLDFFEFYVLLERYIVLCLGLCDVKVPRGEPATALGSAVGLGVGTHRFHANLLDALDQETCVLHAALGTGDTRRCLGLAKEYRNKWKDADADADGLGSGIPHSRARVEDLDLPHMLKSLIVGLEGAKKVVEERAVRRVVNGVVVREEGEKVGVGWASGWDAMDVDDTPYEAVEDGMEMEWEL
ncbi:hypothetical protein EJ05DRAFT_509532 [Pseudovirgaria hyperparasitica]|uniref:Uncharacterized protein n=1 Tax=Pseudovirgaria hyperparasitica TaxID=470096 RepID=A0A6A6WCD4_9PEZI|nr:uncharacterized protein EJ05DRAFT_509532 [Pseudovirgaria hyperparasitica]KAF2759839.1 hypothetical protein EJ05DRAFT_509532 [Pseudovirgaria hyperparasitica]